jgi:hypothetical protein
MPLLNFNIQTEQDFNETRLRIIYSIRHSTRNMFFTQTTAKLMEVSPNFQPMLTAVFQESLTLRMMDRRDAEEKTGLG